MYFIYDASYYKWYYFVKMKVSESCCEQRHIIIFELRLIFQVLIFFFWDCTVQNGKTQIDLEFCLWEIRFDVIWHSFHPKSKKFKCNRYVKVSINIEEPRSQMELLIRIIEIKIKKVQIDWFIGEQVLFFLFPHW